MRKFELTITPDYCAEWGLVDAIRELFQNALDQKTLSYHSEIYFDYDKDDEILRIGNTNAVLELQSLLFGSSSKRESSDAIGQFGEGYKIATLVLLRLGKGIKFFNQGASELWEPRFVNSRIYKTKILTFFVSKVPYNGRNDLMVEITGITPQEYAEIVESNLHLQEPEEVIETDYGCILKSEQNAGKIFVNGLFVCKHEKYKYGYDFKPAFLNLGRDRKLVSDWDLQWLSSKMWKASKANLPELARLIKDEAADVAYYDSIINYYGSGYNNEVEIANIVYDQFKEEHGELAVPVSSEEEKSKVAEKYRPIIVKDLYKKLILKSENYNKQDAIIPEESIVDKFSNLFESIKDKLDEQDILRFNNCLNKLREVSYKL